MRIAMIVEAWDPIWGGGQVHALELSKWLASDHACAVDIFTMNLPDAQGKKQLEITNLSEGVRLIRVGKKRSFHSFTGRLNWIAESFYFIRKFHHRKYYDIIHAHSNLPGFSGKILGQILKIPVVYTVHGANFLDIGKKNFYYWIEKLVMTSIRYDLEITVSSAFLKHQNRNKPVIIPNGVSVNIFDEARINYIDHKDVPVKKILFVGRFDKIKGIDILLQAVTKLRESDIPQFQIHLVGYGYEENNLRELTKSLGIEKIVLFKGKKVGSDLLREYFSSDLFILPSLSEGFPISILEAWAAKLPVLASQVGEIPNLIEDGQNGFLVRPGDASILADKIRLALRDPRLKMIGEEGYRKTALHFNWKSVADQTYAEYLKVIKR